MEIHRIVEGPLEANCYIIYKKDGAAAYVIDPGYDTKRTIAFVREHGLAVSAILLTHSHHDHSGKAEALAKAFDCEIYAGREELDYYRGRVDRVIDGGEVLNLDGENGEVIEALPTPGHSAGGVCYYSKKSRVAFTGDTIFNVDLGYTHFEGGSAERMRESLRNVVNKWDNGVTIYPGHGDSATMKTVREINREFIEAVRG
ncbi:MAG: MBL fold metallo-hydrolase [Clostridiales Family XIII bacterium]|jgi:glyoxylase-like metal-dependent hydrolase (beta-lactamase superfamily II)|nr:MBL fold metallo-hydrolase [Clostridiales Family XIII bacterium]